MGMDSRNEIEKSMLSPQAQQKLDELVTLRWSTEFSLPSGWP